MFPHAYPLEFFHTACALIGVCVNSFTWMIAKVNLRYAELAEPYDGEIVAAGRTMVRREYVSLVYVQGLMLGLGILSLYYPPPPWAWGDAPWRTLLPDQRSAVFYAWAWRMGVSVMCLRKAVNSLQNWFEERPLRRRPGSASLHMRRATDAQSEARVAQTVAASEQAQAVAALKAEQPNGGV